MNCHSRWVFKSRTFFSALNFLLRPFILRLTCFAHYLTFILFLFSCHYTVSFTLWGHLLTLAHTTEYPFLDRTSNWFNVWNTVSTWRGTHSKLLEIIASVRMEKTQHQTFYDSRVLSSWRKHLKDKMDRRYFKLALGTRYCNRSQWTLLDAINYT